MGQRRGEVMLGRLMQALLVFVCTTSTSTSETYSTINHGTIHMVTEEISITVSGDPY